MDELRYIYFLKSIKGLGEIRIKKLVSRCRNFTELENFVQERFPIQELAGQSAAVNIERAMMDTSDFDDSFIKLYDSIVSRKIKYTTIISKDYPKNLIEVIVVDQGSDNYLTLQNNCKWFASNYPEIKFRYFQHYDDELENCTIRRNTGIRYASNDIILMTESDTIFLGNDYFKILSWEFTCDPNIFVMPFFTGIGGDIQIEQEKLDQVDQCYIKTPVDSWLTNVLINERFTSHVMCRFDHDFCNAFSREAAQKAGGFGERNVGYGGIEEPFYRRCNSQGLVAQVNFNLICLLLYNFPYKLKSSLHLGDYEKNYPVNRDAESWGITEKMEEINLY